MEGRPGHRCLPSGRQTGAPGPGYGSQATNLAKEATGRAITANIVALGALNAACGLVSPDALVNAVLDSVPKGTEAINRKALEAGAAAVAQ